MKLFSRSASLLPLTLLLPVFLAACFSSGPQKTLNAMAEALQKKDSAAFLVCLDLKLYASNEIKNLTRDNQALNSLNSLGRMMGLGEGMMDNLLDNVLNMESQLRQQYTRGVSTGEMENQCRAAQTPDCPWTPDALKKAQVRELSADAAVALVTTQARVTSWLAMQKKGERWLVVGRALLEDAARAYAADKAAPPESGPSVTRPAPPAPAPEKKLTDKPASDSVTKI
ncbi:MAG: hypothetical protein LBB66_08830 [Desulfovibrio sp.]|jgi:hypothetical protein|nr:hypothetical protein [Desulfovibrio sp.]